MQTGLEGALHAKAARRATFRRCNPPASHAPSRSLHYMYPRSQPFRRRSSWYLRSPDYFYCCLSWAVYFSTYNTWTFASVLTIISRSLLGGDARTKTTFFREYLSLASEAAVGVKNGAILAPPPARPHPSASACQAPSTLHKQNASAQTTFFAPYSLPPRARPSSAAVLILSPPTPLSSREPAIARSAGALVAG